MAEIQGTSFLVHDTWYLRYLSGGGAMVVIEANTELKSHLVDGQLVTIIGDMSTDHRGCPQRVVAKEIRVSGNSKV